MKNFTFLYVLAFCMIGLNLGAQNPALHIQNISGCPGSEIMVPVDITDFENVGAITLFVEYDTTVLQFVGIENTNPQFTGIIYNPIIFPQPQLGFSWSDYVGVSVTQEKLFDLKFTYSGGTCELTLNRHCEIADNNLQILDVEYTEGQVTQVISFLNQPEDSIVNQPDPVQFSISSNGVVNFAWQVSTDGGEIFTDMVNSAEVQGVDTPNLELLITDTTMDANLYRCRVSEMQCELFSEAAVLTVLQELHTATHTFPPGWSSLSSYINPDDAQLDNMFEQILESVEILISGDQVYYPQGGVNTIGPFDPYSGYAIKMSANKNLDITGYKVDSTSIFVPEGWSYLPVLSSCDVPVGDVSPDFLQHVIMIKEIAGMDLLWAEKGINSLSTLRSGRAYLILMEQSEQLTYPGCN